MLTAKAAAERCCAALGGFRLIHSFLLIGQSNMAGRGFLNEAVDVDNSHIKILRNGRWQKMFRPINPAEASPVCPWQKALQKLMPRLMMLM